MLRGALGTSSGPSLCHVLPGLLLAGKLMQLSLVSTVLEKQQKAKETKLAFLAVLYGGASYEEKGKKKGKKKAARAVLNICFYKCTAG